MTITRLIARLNLALDESVVVIADPGDALFASSDLVIHRQTEFLAPAYYTSMGFAVPAALGVMVARPDLRPIVLVGDGAFQMTGMELSTVVHYGFAPIIIVLDNKGYGTERLLFPGDHAFNDIQPWQYHKLPAVLGGGTGYEVTTEGQFDAALSAALADRKGLSLIQVHSRSARLQHGLAAAGQSAAAARGRIKPGNLAMAKRFRLTKLFLFSLMVIAAVIALKLAFNYCLTHVPRRSGVLVTISKETTCITEPLRPDGYPDYIAALNNRSSKGVTPENNAVVPFFRAMGPGMVDARYRDEYCKLLGIGPPPERGEYFVAVDVYAKTLKPAKPGDRPDVEYPGPIGVGRETAVAGRGISLGCRVAGGPRATTRPRGRGIQAAALVCPLGLWRRRNRT